MAASSGILRHGRRCSAQISLKLQAQQYTFRTISSSGLIVYWGFVMATAPHTLASLSEISRNVADWVTGVAELTRPDRVHWCDGTQREYQRLRGELTARGELLELNPHSFPSCHLYRSDPTDVARVEHLTYICTRSKAHAG